MGKDANLAGSEGEGLVHVWGSYHKKKGGGEQIITFTFSDEVGVVAPLRVDKKTR